MTTQDKRKEALRAISFKVSKRCCVCDSQNRFHIKHIIGKEIYETIRKALQQPEPFTCSEEIADVYIDAFNNPDAVIRVVKDCPAPEVVGVEEFNQGFINHPEPTNITMYIKQEYPNGIKIVEDK